MVPLIDNDYILVDLPYHSNIGDILIWEGECCFLNSLPFKCIYSASMHTYKKQKLTNDTIILIHGGGNWGDVWRPSQDFHLKIIQEYPDNKIIVFPQTVHYDNQQNLEYDISIISRHKNLTICTRDNVSFELLKKKYLNTKVLLVPDMAFCINSKYLLQFERSNNGRVLWVKRQDSEMPDYSHLKIDVDDTTLDIQDWPTMMSYDFVQINFYRIYNRRNFLLQGLTDLYADKILRPHIVKEAVRFISQYNYIYTSRLHVATLSVLLGKPFTLIDNSYGKNLNLYKAWLSDIDTIKLES